MCQNLREGGLGFRDFSLFNQVLLAKQGWKILTQPSPTLLWSDIFNQFISKATLFFEPSHLRQHQVLWGTKLLNYGIGWRRVGDGKNISIWLPEEIAAL